MSVLVCVCVCVLERGRGVSGRPEASMGKHKLQTVEITGVQTGRDPEQDPAFHSNPPPQTQCSCCMLRGRERDGKKKGETMTNQDERKKAMMRIFLV